MLIRKRVLQKFVLVIAPIAEPSAMAAVFRFISWTCDLLLHQYSCTNLRGMSVDHASAVAAPKSDPVFLFVKAGMTVILTDNVLRDATLQLVPIACFAHVCRMLPEGHL